MTKNKVKVKKVKAWAIVSELNGNILDVGKFGWTKEWAILTKEEAKKYLKPGTKIIPCEITYHL